MDRLLFFFLLLCSQQLWAENLRLAMPFTHHCVLQRYQPILVEGEAAAGSTVTVTLGGCTAKATVANDGKWTATLPPMKEAVGLTLTATSGSETVHCEDVAVGEVWVASGQSNMAFMLCQTDEAKTVCAKAGDPQLRFLDMKPRYQTTGRPWSEEARSEVNAGRYYSVATWTESTPQSAAQMSAVAYYFARMLRDSLQVPVGIIHNAIGGAPTEAWTSMGALRAFVPEILEEPNLIQDWVRQRTAENVGTAPEQQHPYKPGYLFATGIEPLRHYAVAGVVWYQGESNAHNTALHERLFETLVADWRNYWQRPQLPFAFVQLSSINRPTWPEFRDSQRRLALRIPNVGMAVSSDHGDSLDVHPHAKQPIGERLARWALHNVYSRADITPSGPQPEQCVTAKQSRAAGESEAVMRNAQCVIRMKYGRGMRSSDGQPLRTFEVAGADGIFYPAEARINGETIEVSSPRVLTPRFVRYAWQPFTRANLVNGDGLPATTFSIMIDNNTQDGFAKGVSAAFAGYTGGCALIAGGCNFPENPLGKDSKKVFYDGIYRIDGDALVRVGTLPCATAYGVSATTPDGILMAGGTDNREAWLVTMNADRGHEAEGRERSGNGGEAMVKPLPSLPCAIDNAYACAIYNKVYVAGGNCEAVTSHGRERSGNTLLCFDGSKWEQLPPIPGNPRTQPVMAAAPNAKGEMCLWLFGGFNAAGEASTLELDGLVYIPSKRKWQTVKGPGVSVAGGCAVTLPDGRILVTGGVNKDIFLSALKHQAPDYLSHPVEWYRFNDAVLLFDPVKREWSTVRHDPETARAGGMLVASPDGTVWLYGGELKPRIRTPKVHRLSM